MRKNILWELAAGLAGGLLGTELIKQTMKRSGKLPESLRPSPPKEDPGEFMVRHAESLVHRALPPKLHRAAVGSMPWAYGSVWPLAFSLLVGRRGWRSAGKLAAAGVGLGALVWAIGALGWLPAAGLSPGVHRQKPGGVASNLIGHLAYGALSTVPLVALQRLRS
jgi:hypothetical protein